jgi:hypothetical protein
VGGAGSAEQIRQALQKLATGTKDETLRDEVRRILSALGDLPDEVTEAVDDAASGRSSGGDTRVQGVLPTGTVQQFDTVIGLLTTQLLRLSEISENTRRAAFASVAPFLTPSSSVTTPIYPPPVPTFALARTALQLSGQSASATSGPHGQQGVQVVVNAVFHFGTAPADVEEFVRLAGPALVTALVDPLNRALGRRATEEFVNAGGSRFGP